MKLYCMVDGCPNFVETKESLAPDARFTCTNHNPPGPDEVRFQEEQFDPDLRRAHQPIGTEHVSNQGSDVKKFIDNREEEYPYPEEIDD